MSRVDIRPLGVDLLVALACARPTMSRACGPIVRMPGLRIAISLARPLGYRVKIFNACRPIEAQ